MTGNLVVSLKEMYFSIGNNYFSCFISNKMDTLLDSLRSLAGVRMQKNIQSSTAKPIDLEDPELDDKLATLFDSCKNMKEFTFALINTFGDELGGGLSTDEIYNFTKFFKESWTVRGPRGGKTLKKTIYAVCANGIKKKELVRVKKNKCAYYYTVKL